MACQCAWAAARTKNTYLSSQFRRLAARRGKKRAIIAVAHTLIVIGYHLQTNQSNRQSLYDTFGDKRALFLKAMAHYRDQTNSQMQKMLNESPSVRDGFTRLLSRLAAETREQHERGCLLLSANLQRDPKDAVVRDFLRDNQARVEAIFLQALARAQKQEELSPKDDPAALARFFVATIQGMRAMARLKSDRKALEQIARIALAVFNSPNTA